MVNIFCQAEQTLYHSNATGIRNRKNMLVSGTIRLKKKKKTEQRKSLLVVTQLVKEFYLLDCCGLLRYDLKCTLTRKTTRQTTMCISLIICLVYIRVLGLEGHLDNCELRFLK